LIETTAGREGIVLQLREDCIMDLPFIGGTQEANLASLIDHDEVFERVAFLLAAVVVLLVLGIGWAVDRSLSTIMPKRGVVDPLSVVCGLNIAANSAAVRAGSKSWSAKA
jgi:hypothetical protein